MKQIITTALLLTIVFPLSAQLDQPENLITGQSPWSFEFRTGAAFSTNNLGNAELNTGFGFEGTFTYRFMPHVEAYAGWGWNKFSADQSFAGPDMDFEETGYSFGLQFIHPFDNSTISYMIKAGGIFNHIETENSNGDIIANSGHGLGWQVEGGLAIPLTNSVRILPSIRYRSLERNTTMGTVTIDTDLRYVSVGAGISWNF